MRSAQAVKQIARQEKTLGVLAGIVRDVRGQYIDVLLDGGRQIKEVGLARSITTIEVGWWVVIVRTPRSHKWIAIVAFEDPSEGSRRGRGPLGDLPQPSSVTATAKPYFIELSWSGLFKNKATYEVQHNSSASESGATMLKVEGSNYFYWCIPGTQRYFRVRAVTSDYERSSWSDWVNATALDGEPHSFLEINAGKTAPAWTAFVWDDVAGVAGASMTHDHSSAAKGGTNLYPKLISNKVIFCGPGMPYTTLAAAIGDAKSNETVVVMGPTTEVGDVTIPDDVRVVGFVAGQNDPGLSHVGPMVDMQTNTLYLGSYGGLSSIYILSADLTAAVICNGETAVRLRDVRIENTSSGNALYIYGATADFEAQDCIFETAQSTAVYVAGSSVAEFNDCRLEAATGGTSIGLGIANTATVTTRHCNIEGDYPVCFSDSTAAWNTHEDVVDWDNCVLIGTITGSNAKPQAAHIFCVLNTSGAARAIGDVGYIDEAGEFKTTTTQYLDANWAVVVVGGANNTDIYVARRGRVTVVLDANCSAGDFLYTSGTATQATPQSYMRPEMFAVALTANGDGAGGTCEALLHCHTKDVPMISSTLIHYVSGSDDTDFRTTISGVAGAVVTYNDPGAVGGSGNENTIDPVAATYLGKVLLYNEDEADYGLIDSVNVGANQITLTANAPAGWNAGDWITARTQAPGPVYGAPPPYCYTIDLSSADNTVVPVLTRSISLEMVYRDTTGTGALFIHPWVTYSGPKAQIMRNEVAGTWQYRYKEVPLYQRRFSFWLDTSGSGTGVYQFKILGWREACP